MKTEAQLRRDVIEKMTAEPLSNVHRLDVEVKDGSVYWSEQIGNFAERSAALRAAYRGLSARPK